MQPSAEELAAKQFMLDQLLIGGDDLTLPHDIEWTHTFLSEELAERFRDLSRETFPHLEFHLQGCVCSCTCKIVPTTLELARISESLGEISMRVANRKEQHSSITSAVVSSSRRT